MVMSAIKQTYTPFGEILHVLMQRKWVIIGVTLFFTIAASVLAFAGPDTFQASIVVSPVADDAGSSGRLGGLAALASQFGGLGGALGLSDNSQKSETIAILKSEALTERFISENNLLPILYASQWDAQNHKWKVMAPEKIPTLWKGDQYFRNRIMSVLTDTKTGLTTVTLKWKSPTQVAVWANGLVRLTNDYLRDKAITDSTRNIGYLKDQLTKTNIVGLESAINTLLENEMKRSMMAQGNSEYALKIIDPAFTPEKRSSPIPALWILTGFVLGLAVSVTGILATHFGPIQLYVRNS
jgi:uncharacterized protein involved in exopolysaccharide biosynthesis